MLVSGVVYGIRDMIRPDVEFQKGDGLTVETDRNSVSVSVTAPKLAIFLVSITAVIVKHGFGLPCYIAYGRNYDKVSA